jgi:hypothetical protein
MPSEINGNVDDSQNNYAPDPVVCLVEVPISSAPGINIENIGKQGCNRYNKGRLNAQNVSEAIPLQDEACCCDQAYLSLVGQLHQSSDSWLKVNKPSFGKGFPG